MILDFLIGSKPDVYNRYLIDIWSMSDEEIENVHNFIQWVFPLNEESRAVLNSPVLNLQEINNIKESSLARENIEKSVDWFFNFLIRNSHWISKSNHNHLRITRIIKSLRLLHSDKKADDFKDSIMKLIGDKKNQINSITLDFWKNS